MKPLSIFLKSSFLTFFLTFSHLIATGQYGMEVAPRVSPKKGTYHKIAYTKINVIYSSPSVKGRQIWGDLVPYDEVWRAGANNATTIEFSHDVEINGQPLSAGKYGYFIIPKEYDKWVLIFNKIHDQWGAFNYSETEDILRVNSLPIRTEFSEELVYTVENKGPEYGIVFLNWGLYKIGFEVKTNHLNLVKEALENSYSTAQDQLKWVSYVEAANYLVEQKAFPELAMEWLNKAEKEAATLKEWSPNFMPKEFILGHLNWLKAQLFAEKGDFNSALKSVEKMKSFEGNYLFYPTQNEPQKIDEKVAGWETEGN